mmetsp:Transcript_6301/g.15121  ORF Transcript_6301/g.15121 Transcript_6301/m.15121 type:complete len:112 (-) Transcript_6301:198-533(-)
MWWRVTMLFSMLFVVFQLPVGAMDEEDMDLDEEGLDEDPAAIMAELDKDGDGFLSVEELLVVDEDGDADTMEGLKRHFAKADADGDKLLSVPELGQLVKNFEEDDSEGGEL